MKDEMDLFVLGFCIALSIAVYLSMVEYVALQSMKEEVTVQPDLISSQVWAVLKEASDITRNAAKDRDQ